MLPPGLPTRRDAARSSYSASSSATAAVAELETEYDDRAAARLVGSPGGANALQHP